jgi:hypothetical protein
MSSWSDKVKESMNTVITETWVTFNSRLLSENVIVLSLKITNNLTETFGHVSISWMRPGRISYLASLSIWSPKPGVSTIVREIRVPSSSNSSSGGFISFPSDMNRFIATRTNSDGLDSDTLFKVGVGRIICILSLEDLLPAQCVHESSPT